MGAYNYKLMRELAEQELFDFSNVPIGQLMQVRQRLYAAHICQATGGMA